ncbi:MAG TPA: hypothetical protein DCM05_04210 [Elusimicrobia bacterium]|nr:hypothetical protein [Elusimicrobiota bacterium]
MRSHTCRAFAALLLAAFTLAVVAHPFLDDAVSHGDDCSVCAMVSQGMAPSDPGPSVTRDDSKAGAAPTEAPRPVLRTGHPLSLGRGPPAS